MIRNYLKVALRNLSRHPGFAIINILGLTLGLALSFLIFLFIFNEFTYDRYHKDIDQLYRIDSWIKAGDRELEVATTCAPMGPHLKEHYPKVLDYVRMGYADYLVMEYGDKLFQDGVNYVDPSIFDLLTINIISGNAETALKEPFSLVMTEKMAKKYFGDEDPIGKVIKASNDKNYTVTCVIEDWPENTHINYDMMAPFKCLESLQRMGPPLNSWLGFNYRTYIKLAAGYPHEELEREFPNIIKNYIESDPMAAQFDFKMKFNLMPVKKIHLYSNIDGETEPGGDFTTILIYFAIGTFILLIACINFMNLTTARSANRLREVGIRKVVGGFRKQLIWQFLTESILISLISLILAATLAEILLPEFNTIIGKNLSFQYLKLWPMTVVFVLLAVIVGFIAGSYPALFLSKFKPVSILHGKMRFGSGSVFFRNFLVIFQFVISIILITCTIVVYKQLGFVRNADMGFNAEQVLVVPLRGDKISQNPELLKTELKKIPEVGKMSVASAIPGRGRMETIFRFEDFEDDERILAVYEIDDQFFDLLDIDILMGRDFDNQNPTDAKTLIINEVLRKQLGWEDPIGMKIVMKDFVDNRPMDVEFTVIGVVDNYNCKSLHTPLEPLVFRTEGIETSYLLAKIESENPEEVIKKIEEGYKTLEHSWPFSSSFLDSSFERYYQNEVKQGKIFMYFAIFAIFIAALGLFGLASFIAEQRNKEIGIRKVLGSSVGSIVWKLTINFIKLVLISAVIAIPVSWYLMSRWLESFAYKINLGWYIFAFATLIAIGIAFVTIAYQSLKAATSNPVDAISYE